MLTNKQKDAGFTLLEVLIALLVLSVGLLGLAGLQTRGLAIGHNAYLRSQAVLLAQDMAERIRSNTNHVFSTELNDSNRYSVEFERSLGTLNCVDRDCSPADMADFDVDQWLANVRNTLPSGDGAINKAGNTYEITIRWDADGTGDLDEFKELEFTLGL